MSVKRWLRLVLPLTLVTLLASACGLGEAPPAVLGPAQWQLTVSPQEPAAGIEAEVTLQRLGPDGKRIPFGLVMPVPAVRARDLDSGLEVPAVPRAIDHRGAWLFDVTFPAPGRWQIAFSPGKLPQPGLIAASPVTWPAAPVVAPAILRDAVGDASVSLVVQVIPDRGPILWFLRTHILEATGVVVILLASVVSYIYRQRRIPAAAVRT